MATQSDGVRAWTRRFLLAGAAGLLAAGLGALAGVGPRTVAVVVVFGFACPTAFGMAYLIVPAVVGDTFGHPRLAGLHFALSVPGAALLLADRAASLATPVAAAGRALWVAGVAVFVGGLLLTVVPALVANPGVVGRTVRSTRAAVAALPVAVGYLVVGAASLGSAAFPRVVHYHAAGFLALLIFAFGARLLVGFYHVAAPRVLSWLVLATGAVGPALLATYLWVDPLFRVGAALEATAVVGYAGMVGSVALRTDRSGPGLRAVVLGALAGALAVVVGLLRAFDLPGGRVAVHATLVGGGFLPLTVVGYATQFFPLTTGEADWVSERSLAAAVLALAAGVTL
jgi:hypothetical protein